MHRFSLQTPLCAWFCFAHPPVAGDKATKGLEALAAGQKALLVLRIFAPERRLHLNFQG